MAEEDDHIDPDVFREQFSDTARELNGLPKQVVSNTIKEKVSMELADKVWVALGISGVVLFRQHRLKKQIKNLTVINAALNKENEILHILTAALAEPGKFAIDKNLLAKLTKF